MRRISDNRSPDTRECAHRKGRALRKSLTVMVCAVLFASVVPAAHSATSRVGSGSGSAIEIETVPFEVVSKDGTVLRGHVHKPKGREGLATVLTLSPYWNSSTGWGPSASLWDADRVFVDAGFAFAAVNIRGSGMSDGCLQLGNEVDRADAYAVVEALADQDWSNGKIGMFGLSYDAWTQYMAIAAGAPSLKAAIPMSGIIDPWSYLTARGAPEPNDPFSRIRLTNSVLATDPNAKPHAACPSEISDHRLAWYELVATGDRTGYFEERDLRPLLRGSDVAVFTTSGVRSLGDGLHNRQYENLWKYLKPERSRFLLGQWGHSYPALSDFMTMAIGWFDHYLRGGPETVQAGIFEYQDDGGRWHVSRSWPPRHVTDASLFLSDGDLVSSRSEVQATSTSFRSSPADPGSSCVAGEGLPLQALYVSDPLKRDATLAGNFEMTTQLSSSLPGGNFAAVLYKTSGDGSCLDLVQNAAEVGRVQLDLRHWKTPGRAEDFPIDTPTIVKLQSEPVASYLAKGDRLVLAIGGGSSQLLPDPLQPDLTVHTRPGSAGWIRLPVVKGRLVPTS